MANAIGSYITTAAFGTPLHNR